MARRLDASAVPRGIDLWVLDDLNPDGAAADTRQNAHGVDLNRNFPYGWRSIGQPGDPSDWSMNREGTLELSVASPS